MYKAASESQQRRTATGNFGQLEGLRKANHNGVDRTVFAPSSDQVEARRQWIVSEIARIDREQEALTEKLRRAREVFHKTGRRTGVAFQKWEADIAAGKQRKGILYQELSQLKYHQKRFRALSFDRMFIDVARETLAGDVFTRIMEITQRRIDYLEFSGSLPKISAGEEVVERSPLV